MKLIFAAAAAATLVSGCAKLDKVGKAPDFKAPEQGNEHFAMARTPIPERPVAQSPTHASSLWRAGKGSLLGSQRAEGVGDIVTVAVSYTHLTLPTIYSV